MTSLNPALEQLVDYPFQRLRDLLDVHEPASGLDVLALTIGEPQHAPPAMLSETVLKNAHLWHKYPPINGTPELRGAIKNYVDRRYGLASDFIDVNDHILPVNGTREALFMCGHLLLNQGEAKNLVLMPNPFYQVYAGAALMNGAKAVYLPASAQDGFLPNLDAISIDTLKQTAVFFLCSPANPQGTVCSKAYLEKALGLAKQYDFTLVMDECYAELYDKEAPTGILEIAAEQSSLENILMFQSLSKRSNAAGLRSGFVIGPKDVLKTFATLRNYGGPTMPLPLQAASAALWDDDAHVIENRKAYSEKFDVVENILGNRLGFYRPQGGFFLWLDVSERWEDGQTAALELWQKGAVRVMPGEFFAKDDGIGDNPGKNYLRVALVHEKAFIEEAFTRIAAQI